MSFLRTGETKLNPRDFDYHAPTSVDEALDLAKKYAGDFKFLAGGQSLIPLMKLRLLSPSHVIDLNGLRDLEYVRMDDGSIALGALTRMSEIEESRLIADECPMLTECAEHIADPIVRNMGTVGGNACHADPTNDIPAVAVAAGAEMVTVGPAGERKISASEFFIDTFTTALGAGELLKEIRIPSSVNRGSAYAKLERQAGDFGIVGVAASLSMAEDGRCNRCSIGLTGVGPTVVIARRAASSLEGRRASSAALIEAGTLAAQESSPVSDLRGPAEYKRKMVEVMTRRALKLALKRAGQREA